MKVVKLPKIDGDPVEEVSKFGGEGIKKCIQCGACMSVCPVAMAGFNYPNKKLFKLIILGQRREILYDPSPWACVACGRCIEVCTRDVNPFSVYFAFRRIQTREFSVPSVAEEALRNLYETGYAVTGNANIRKELGLPEVKFALNNGEALKEIRCIIESTEIMQLGILPRREMF
ncbi:4Fe-4S dicluster domain-containing protein [Archaeoglobus neptunius]|uniref:4Fe-4S dicluster domain-containing protein n=1 Tax=Archaeoglobus neptunius TaxID=2798580 RepID=UPI0019276A56|nr:4Fe-4S dicluster domain-containing protein [Archaeoglobus neptunius]